MDVSFDNVTYTVSVGKREKKHVLNGVSGRFQSGELTAIMGPSGAGKSSLLNILTGYITQGVKGTLSFGGHGHTNRKLCSYILQEDYLQPLFTVEEIMVMACDLKVSSNSLNRTEKHRLIDNILDTLHLSFCKQTRCGSLSGGQRKRLSIALELIDNPPILFLDEPTTGLDSSSSLYTIKLLQGLAREGRTIVCTIHQPSATVYEMFDHVYVLADGNCVYQGTALNTVPYLRSVGLHCPPYHNAADYLLEVTNKEYGNFTETLAKAATDPSWRLVVPTVTVLPPPPPPTYDSNHNDAEYQGAHRILEELEPTDAALPLTKEPAGIPVKPEQPHRKPSEFAKLLILMKRANIQLYRDWTVTHLKLFVHIVCAIVIGLLFGDSGINATKSISNVASFLVHILYLWYTTLMPGVLKYPYEMNILRKESFNRWYKIRTYFVASMLTSLPVQIFFTIVYASIVYLMTSQPCELERYLMFTAVLVLNTIVADGFGLFLGTFLNEINGTFIGAIMTCFMFVFCGFFIMFSHMSEAMRGISYLSSHRYGFEALVLTAYDDNRADLVCPGDQIYCHYTKPNTMMRELGVVPGNYLFNVVTLVVHFVAIKLASFWTLKRKLRHG
ncbi:ATP-binding cassette sub-family G member 1-like [Anopheles albimanus]|uniref:ATP-binding cassette sub-family G member 1-like n=1 Tax=Anopheles albimanus TaxID=7167 RepID=UPI00163E9A5B|nr:ATP-binding cassette sub-family G member 1-like [Anopheles albimanus]XP_035794877.1 ATP-binding cassette sub-family G member 1-like [Anopheles albimanus]XP_035794878.1 ATP-binding cassette sub-family G member 1-like [Anopheles albimanus]XP_035794881.1 ATP-binding cassette sub-family G member 1-like [Anopheles albimanus]XP_035794885.1 ATP-binding cassette sub-family G member 1-like [Anopheles albimanus]XP_035794890.1 ATP-binding cassette sub-family G member 1-like [Anopheles albimanus]XP_03